MRIGIVGTGIAGLSAAWILKRNGHAVTLFEKHDSLGMDAHSVDFEFKGNPFRSDVPPRMFNRSQWPNLVELYEAIGVEFEAVEATKSFSTFAKPAVLSLGDSYLPKMSTNLVLNSTTRKILADIRTMMNSAGDFVDKVRVQKDSDPSWVEPTFAQYLRLCPYENPGLPLGEYSNEFIKQFLYPALSSTVCTCSYEALGAFPASTMLDAMLNISKPEGLFRTTNGTKDVVARLTGDVDEINLNSPVTSVGLSNEGEGLESVFVIVDGIKHKFDHVIIATQANVTLEIVDGLSKSEQDVLASFKYENVTTIVHTDESLMTARPKDWETFNLISNPDHTSAMCTIWLNKFYPEWNLDQPVFQTILPFTQPDPAKVICVAKMQRPILDLNSSKVQAALSEIQKNPNRRIWFTGSYASPGIPLLESGVCASLNVATSLASGLTLSPKG